MKIKSNKLFYVIISLFFNFTLISSYANATEDAFLYTDLNQNEIFDQENPITALIIDKNNQLHSLPVSLYKLKKLDRYLALMILKNDQVELQINDLCDPKAKVSFYQSLSNYSSVINNDQTLNWHNFECFKGNQSEFTDRFRANISSLRSELQLKKSELKETASATNRLRKDARLIAGYDRIEQLKKERQVIEEQIQREQLEQKAIDATLTDDQRSLEPRGFNYRQASLTGINKELLSKLGGQDISDSKIQAQTTESEIYERLKGVDLSVLEDNLNRLIAERVELERSFGYAPGEFRLLQE
jgi:hypothetical protein